MNVAVAVAVAVDAPVVVAALVNGSDAVAVITARERARNLRQWRPISRASKTMLYERRVELLERIVAMLTKLVDP